VHACVGPGVSVMRCWQLEVKKNKKILGDLKTDNKKLRSDLSSLMSDQGKNTNSSDVNKLEKQVQDLHPLLNVVSIVGLHRKCTRVMPLPGLAYPLRCRGY
jgi:hypothetical protein